MRRKVRRGTVRSGGTDRRDRRVRGVVKPMLPEPSVENLADKVADNQQVWRKLTEAVLTENFNRPHSETITG